MTYYDFLTVQGKDKVRLPIAGLRTQLFHLIFTEPGNSTLAHPCTNLTSNMTWDRFWHRFWDRVWDRFGTDSGTDSWMKKKSLLNCTPAGRPLCPQRPRVHARRQHPRTRPRTQLLRGEEKSDSTH